MNNSFLAQESISLELEPENLTSFRQREGELVAIIDAIQKVNDSYEWKLLEEKIFNGVVEGLKRRIESEVNTKGEKSLNGPKIHFLNGQLEWAKKYTDFLSLAHIYKQELTNIRIKLNAKD